VNCHSVVGTVGVGAAIKDIFGQQTVSAQIVTLAIRDPHNGCFVSELIPLIEISLQKHPRHNTTQSRHDVQSHHQKPSVLHKSVPSSGQSRVGEYWNRRYQRADDTRTRESHRKHEPVESKGIRKVVGLVVARDGVVDDAVGGKVSQSKQSSHNQDAGIVGEGIVDGHEDDDQ
jgi:hypothetical protein